MFYLLTRTEANSVFGDPDRNTPLPVLPKGRALKGGSYSHFPAQILTKSHRLPCNLALFKMKICARLRVARIRDSEGPPARTPPPPPIFSNTPTFTHFTHLSIM